MSTPGEDGYSDNQRLEELKNEGVLTRNDHDLREQRYLSLEKRLNELNQIETKSLWNRMEKLGVKMGKWSVESPNKTEQVAKVLIPVALAAAGLAFAGVKGIAVARGVEAIPKLANAIMTHIEGLDIFKGVGLTNLGKISENILAWQQGIRNAVTQLVSGVEGTAAGAGESLLGAGGAGAALELGKPWQRLLSHGDMVTGKVAAVAGSLFQSVGRKFGNNNLKAGETNG